MQEEEVEEEIIELEVLSQKVPAQPQSREKDYTMYTVQKNDTLQKISQKFYGTTKKWMKLFEVNKEVLKSPDKVYPGITIKVPSSL